MKLFLSFIQLLLATNQCIGQSAKEIKPSNQVWFAYYNQTRLSDKWSLAVDVHLRRTDFLANWSTQLFKPGVVYHVAKKIQFIGGHAYARSYSTEPDGDIQPEHRPWQEIDWEGKLGKIKASYWVRVEERFLHTMVSERVVPGYTFNFRFRLMVSGQLPLYGSELKPGIPSVLLQNEILFNAGQQITYNYFDQNRLFFGFVYPFSEQFEFQAGYQNVFQQLAEGNEFERKHVLQVSMYHTIDLR